MSVSIYALDKTQFNQGGVPLASGKLLCYAAGTTTKINTYTSSTGGTANANPVILDANGQCDLWLTDGVAYKFVLSPSTDTDPPTHPYWTVDNQFNTGGEVLTELPNTTSATEGEGMVGYNSSLSYASGTVGRRIKCVNPRHGRSSRSLHVPARRARHSLGRLRSRSRCANQYFLLDDGRPARGDHVRLR